MSKLGWNLISSNFLQIESLKFHNEGIIQGNRKRKLKNWRIARKIFVNQNKKLWRNMFIQKKSILHDPCSNYEKIEEI